MVIHKACDNHNTLCGIFIPYPGRRINIQWRFVTCKKCLKMGKKEGRSLNKGNIK
jgi:hypothetical protein